MTKERLEEIRHRERAEDAVVYTVFGGDKKATALYISPGGEDDNELFMAYINLERVYETKEEAEWYCKMTAERIERFEPPMWEEIKDKYSFGFMNCKNSVVRFSVFKKCNSLNHIVVYSCDYDDYIYRDISTKENYEKACEIVRDLFKGENNGKEVK